MRRVSASEALVLSPTVRQEPHEELEIDHLKTDLKGRSMRGGALTIAAQGFQFFLQMLSTVVLARLLTPGDFGLVAMVTAFTGLAQLLNNVGLSQATIQSQEISHDQVSTLFWINVSVSAAVTLLIAALAPVLAWFYSEPRLTGITLAVAGTFVLSGLMIQHDAILKRQMRYLSLAVRDVASSAAGVVAALVLARSGGGYWALVALPGVAVLARVIFSWFMIDWRPGPPRRTCGVRPLVVFGGNLTAANLLAYFSRNTDNVLIGWFWGAGPLGLYSKAYGLLLLPLRQINWPLASVAIPTFSRLQDDPERYARYYLRTVNMIMWVSALLMGFLFVSAEPVILVALGEQWRQAAKVFQILVVSALVQPLYNTVNWLFVSQGRTNRLLIFTLIVSPAIVASFFAGLPSGITGVAFAYSLVTLAMLPWTLTFAFRGTHLTLKRLGHALLYPLVLCIAAVLFSMLALRLVAPQGDVSKLLVSAAGFATVYALSAVIPSVRDELLRLGRLLRDLRPSRMAA
jgi:PST family polysaccharide transporter